MEIKQNLPYKGCEICGAFEPEIHSGCIWEKDVIIGRNTEMHCKNSHICMDIRIAVAREQAMEGSPEKTGEERKKIFRSAK